MTGLPQITAKWLARIRTAAAARKTRREKEENHHEDRQEDLQEGPQAEVLDNPSRSLQILIVGTSN